MRESSRETMRRKLLTLGIAIAFVMAACSSSSRRASPSTSSQVPSTTARQATVTNPDVIPPVITVSYVNAVFKVLNHVNGDAVRALVANRQVTPAVHTYLRAIYNDPLYAEEVKIASESIQGSLTNVRDPPGDRVTTASKLIDVSPACLFVMTNTDLSEVVIHSTRPAASEYYRLTPKERNTDPEHLNPTPWALSFNATYLTPTSIPDQCPAS
jgi:hypothetical protein